MSTTFELAAAGRGILAIDERVAEAQRILVRRAAYAGEREEIPA